MDKTTTHKKNLSLRTSAPPRPLRLSFPGLQPAAALRLAVMVGLLGCSSQVLGEAPVAAADSDSQDKTLPKLPDPPGAKRLDANYDAWLDMKQKQVILDGEICLRRGRLEMFACTRGSKEHESIVTLDTKAYLAHAALLRLGAVPGGPAQFDPAYKPASGTEIEIQVEWRDRGGKLRRARAQEWIRDLSTKKAMAHVWVFAGSGFWTDESTGQQHYQAEGGDFICVSNFPSAMLDLTVQSTQANQDLRFEAFTDRIPPLGTPVRLILRIKAP